MNKKLLLIALSFLSASVLAQPEPTQTGSSLTLNSDKFDISFSPTAFHMFGRTEYNFILTEQVIDTGGQIIGLTTRSRLEFPLDVLMVGGSVGINSPETADKFWSIEAGYYINLNNPKKSMLDSDWSTLENYYSETLFSFTHSNAEMNTTLFNAEATRELFTSNNVGIAILAGFRYQRIQQDITGYNGWFITDLSDSLLPRDTITSTEQALYYRVTYQGPQIGALTRIDFNQSLQVNLKTAASLTWIDDLDSHILRGFHTFSDGHGLGFISNVNIRWFWNRQLGGRDTYIDFMGSFDYYEANLTKTLEQYAYGGPSEAPVGYTTGGLPHDIKSQQFRVGLRFGMML